MTATATTAKKLLRSQFVDLLLGPHGIDRYLELIRPSLTVRDARAEVLAVQRQTARSVTLTLRPNAAWTGFQAGQFVRVGTEIDGVRRTRTVLAGVLAAPRRRTPRADRDDASGRPRVEPSAPAAPARRDPPPGRSPGGLRAAAAAVRQRLVLISGGSGITPVLSMLRTLCDEGHDGEIAFVHYARTQADWLYRRRGRPTRRNATPTCKLAYVATREGGEHLREDAIAALLPGFAPADTTVAVCGPPPLLDAVRAIWAERRGASSPRPSRHHRLTVTGAAADGTLRFLRSDRAAPIGRRDAARAGRGRRPLTRLRLPDGHLPHLHVPQVCAARCATS